MAFGAVPFASLPTLLDNVGSSWPGGRLRLFSNNRTVIGTETVASFTESAAGGYAAIVIGEPPAAVADGNDALFDYGDFTFMFTGAGNIYGYYVTDAANAVLYFAQNYDGTLPLVVSNGAEFKITPRVRLKDILV